MRRKRVRGDWFLSAREAMQPIAESLAKEPETTSPPSWSASWPTEPGWYWFYGTVGQVQYPLLVVKVVSIMDGELTCRTLGRDLIGATGLWLPLEMPEVPETVVE